MPARFEVDPDAMRRTVDDLRDAAAAMEGELDGLARHLDVLSYQWTGSAAEAYQSAQSEWNASMGDVRHTLDTAAALLDDAIDVYVEAEATVIRECG